MIHFVAAQDKSHIEVPLLVKPAIYQSDWPASFFSLFLPSRYRDQF